MVNVEQFTKEQLKDLAFTQEEIMQLEKARKMPLSFDEECPETTPELALKFKRVNPSRRVANC